MSERLLWGTRSTCSTICDPHRTTPFCATHAGYRFRDPGVHARPRATIERIRNCFSPPPPPPPGTAVRWSDLCPAQLYDGLVEGPRNPPPAPLAAETAAAIGFKDSGSSGWRAHRSHRRITGRATGTPQSALVPRRSLKPTLHSTSDMRAWHPSSRPARRLRRSDPVRSARATGMRR